MRDYKSGTYTQLPSGKWRGRVSTPDGRRVSATRDTEKQVKDELRRLAGKVASGAPVASTSHTVKTWMAVWLEEAEPTLAPRTRDSYESYIRLYILPAIGKHKLTALRPEHVNAVTKSVIDQGLSPSTALKCRAVLRRSLAVAQRYGHVAVNVADLTDAPKQTEPDRPYLTGDEAKKVLQACHDDRLRARYATALYLGLRQGELLGLRWVDVDLDKGHMQVRQQIQRLTWRHGCQPARPEAGKPAACGKVRGADCPKRHSGGATARAPKSKAGRRTIPIPAPLLVELKAHRKRQAAERLHAGSHWQDHGLVFTQPNGRPIDNASDLKAWRELLGSAGVTVGGTHMARRTCATLLLESGVDAKIVSAIIGHTSVALTQNVYQQANLALLEVGTDAIGRALGPTIRPAQQRSYMTMTEVARSLQLTIPQLRKIIARGELTTVERSGRKMILEADVDAFYRKVQAEWG